MGDGQGDAESALAHDGSPLHSLIQKKVEKGLHNISRNAPQSQNWTRFVRLCTLRFGRVLISKTHVRHGSIHSCCVQPDCGECMGAPAIFWAAWARAG